MTMSSGLSLALLCALASSARGLRLTAGSPCERYCGNELSATTMNDIECFDNPSEYGNTNVGNVFQDCITCQMLSTYANAGQTDMQWLLYNLRFSLSACLFGVPDKSKQIYTGPCITSTACGPLRHALEWQNLTTVTGQYDFCRAWDSLQFNKCQSCLKAGDHYVITNFMTMLEAACHQLPPLGRTISVSGNPFSTNFIEVKDPTPTGYVFVPEQGPLTLAAKVGIAVAGVVLLLLVAGFGIVCNGKRRRRAFLRELEKRHGLHQGNNSHDRRWPGAGAFSSSSRNGGDMFETPVSQKALFSGWGDPDPVSAVTDHSTGLSPAMEQGMGPSIGGANNNYATTYNNINSSNTKNNNFPSKYFSPYNSQFNSPVSAQENTAMMHWPSQEKLAQLAQMEREREMRAAGQGAGNVSPLPQEIRLAFGGDDTSLRSKRSDLGAQNQANAQQQQNQYFYSPPSQQQHQQEHEQQHQATWSPDVKGKYRDPEVYTWSPDVKGKQPYREEYELHEVDSDGSLRAPSNPSSQPPLLHHPGYGRNATAAAAPPSPAPPPASQQQWV